MTRAEAVGRYCCVDRVPEECCVVEERGRSCCKGEHIVLLHLQVLYCVFEVLLIPTLPFQLLLLL